MPITIRFLGTAAFEIVTVDGKRILVDPYLDENPVSPIKVADLDHLDLLLVHIDPGAVHSVFRRQV